jgi:S1-C subfamily serine protease
MTTRARWPVRTAVQGLGVLVGMAAAATPATAQDRSVIEKVKASVVAVGTYQATRVPPFRFLGTGFVVGTGETAATSAHVLPAVLEAGADPEVLVALPPAESTRSGVRRLTTLAIDRDTDLALLRMDGAPLPALTLRDSASVREGDSLLFTGFPVGNALGLFAATHRAMVAAIAPMALPSATSTQLDAKTVRSLRRPAIPIFQLDGTAHPGSSGSPLYDPANGEVVGVVNMGVVRATRESALAQPSGITYAVPSKHLISLLQPTKR